MITKAEHLDWCKQRAREFVAEGNTRTAIIGLASDLQNHPETAGHIGISMMVGSMMTGGLSDPAAVLRFIDGFN